MSVTNIASVDKSMSAVPIPQANHRPSDNHTTDRLLGIAIAQLNSAQNGLESAQKKIRELEDKLARMESLATTDSLTGLKNRRGFDEMLARELDRTRRKKSVGGVLVMIDLDCFKQINDTYGHQAGDACLKLVGFTLAHDLRAMDTAARLGGDEFVLLLTDTDTKSVSNRLQYVVSRLNNLSIIWEGAEIAITASIGIKPFDKQNNADDIIAAADENMYTDKRARRYTRLAQASGVEVAQI